MDFWDFSAPFYDLAMKANGSGYGDMLGLVNEIVPEGATVLEAAAGTGSISLAVAEKAGSILCTDISEKMLNVARRKAKKHGIKNIEIANRSIYDLGEPDSSFDIVIAGHILHLIDEPERAAAEIRRIARSMVLLPMSFAKDLGGMARFSMSFYRLFGFAPRMNLRGS